MIVYKLPSCFVGDTNVFYYPAEKKIDKTILLLKGLYGEHTPEEKGPNKSWDNYLIELLNKHYDILIFRTGRRDLEDKIESFQGKTFEQECEDVSSAFRFCVNNIVSNYRQWQCVGSSFGGTTLLGCPEIIQSMQNIVLVGTGCGRSSTTSKPLLSTLPPSEQLLISAIDYSGSLFFLSGEMDTVVPIESQRAVFDSFSKSSMRGWIRFPHLDHRLINEDADESNAAVLIGKFLLLSQKRC